MPKDATYFLVLILFSIDVNYDFFGSSCIPAPLYMDVCTKTMTSKMFSGALPDENRLIVVS